MQLLCYGGLKVLSLACKALGNVAASTVVGWRKKAPKYKLGRSLFTIMFNLIIIVGCLAEYGLRGVPLLLAEDGTGSQKRMDVVQETGPDGSLECVVYGLACGRLVVQSEKEIGDAVLKYGMATTLYVVSIIPLIAGWVISQSFCCHCHNLPY